MCEKTSFYRVYLSCRRGILELDIIFIKFLEEEYMFLDEEYKKQFDLLLRESDQDLYMWLVKNEDFYDLSLSGIILKIKTFVKNLKFN